ncbi:uncharacterized protein YehS (DUF1456 family) [Pseudomonas duriflava]|uniref:Uncharacterized protein YehS (DUF1456 family) n=1 Tax=Pseudomonas duriflava TaxID=459528 RepID=A0A562Q8Y2_9PSED|nr:DUF1456 family protein [Pseudomonas duriflava]TWI53179.1 uncharacterized protein YehS (DUF1456 family) [Pseudomonas duriflava]
MLNNDVLRSVRYMLDIDDASVVDILKLADCDASLTDIKAYLKKDDEPEYLPCPDEIMVHFLDGLIFHLRGKDESRPARPLELPVTNNLVMKKLRVAFELKEDDIRNILQSVNFPIAKAELSAVFRTFGHSNYRTCGDQLLRNFLKGLTQRVRG